VLRLNKLWPHSQTLDSGGKACQGLTHSLLRKSVNYGRNMFYNTGPRLEGLTRDKRASLFVVVVSNEEEKSFV
jgi:hypothetical protein